MKNFIAIILCLLIPSLASAGPAMRQLQAGISSGVCTKDTSNLVMDESTMSADASYDMSANAVGQSVLYGSVWNSFSLETHFGGATSSCVYTVRIGTSSDLTTYIEEWASQNAPDGGGLAELVSVSNDAYSASTTYYIGLVEVSGSCFLLQDNTSPPYADGSWITAGTGWVMDAPSTTRDNHINVYKCK